MQTLYFILNGQELKKAPGFPLVVEKSSNFLKVFVRGIPDGYFCTAYFALSWENKKVYSLPMTGNECIIDEYITTLPQNPSDYYDYKVYMSIAGTNESGSRLTTNPVEIILDKTTYSSTTENTPEIPQSQYQLFVDAVKESASSVVYYASSANSSMNSAIEAEKNANQHRLAAEEAKTDAETAAKKAENLVDSINSENKVNVKSLGVKGDGSPEDIEKIQNALNTYDTIVFPEGTYRVKGLTVTKSNTKIVGENATLQITDDCTITGRSMEGLCLYIRSANPAEPVRNIEVCGIHFKGNAQHFYDNGKDVTEDDFDNDGIHCYNAENVHIHHCTFDDLGDRGIGTTVRDYDTEEKREHFGVHGLHVHDCEFFKGPLPYQDVTITDETPAGTDGYKPTPGTYRIYPTVNAIQILQTGEDACDSDIVIERCIVHKSPNYGFMFYPSTQRLTVRDCTIMNCGLHTSEDPDVLGGPGFIDYGYYKGNYKKGTHDVGGGIKLNTVRDALVERCYIYGVRGSNISVHTASDAAYDGAKLDWPTAKNIVLRDNVLEGNPNQLRSGHGIYIEGGENVRVVNNTILNQVGAADRVHAVHSDKTYSAVNAIISNVPCLIDGNTIEHSSAENNAAGGISLYSGQVLNNTIIDAKTPIYAKTVSPKYAEDLIISGNKIVQANADLKTVKAIDIQIVANTIVCCNNIQGTSRGVQVFASSENVAIYGNLFKNCVRPIIPVITDNELADGGVSEKHDNLNIYGNTFTRYNKPQVNNVVYFENTMTSGGKAGTFKPTNSKVDFVPVYVPEPEPEPET